MKMLMYPNLKEKSNELSSLRAFMLAFRGSHWGTLSMLITGIILGCLYSSLQFRSLQGSGSIDDSILYNKYIRSEFYKNNEFTRGSNPFDIETTKRRLLNAFPYNPIPGAPIERNIIQSWKDRPENNDEFPYLPLFKKWEELNPEYNHLYYSDAELFEKVQMTFEKTVPEVWETFQMLPKIILNSDMGRYILVFLEGGVYADLDTDPKKPLSEWFDRFNYDIGMLVGIEEDMNREDWESLMPRRVQFLQWTFKSRKHHPVLAEVIAKIVKITFEAKYKNKLRAYFAEYKEKEDRCSSVDIIEWTGPAVFTDVIYNYMNSLIDPTVIDMDIERTNGPELYGPFTDTAIDWRLFTGVSAPVVVGDIAVLPRISFRYEPFLNGDLCTRYCYVTHIFSSSWKSG